MGWSHYSTRVPGKWVLTGEHSVLRGATAIALPQKDLSLSLSFEPDAGEVGMQVIPGESHPLITDLVTSIAESWEADGHSFQMPRGKLRIDSTIPIGAGLGSSAALCVALTRWMSGYLRIPENQWMDFATQLEHRFHGRSSGMDVAVITSGEPISYVMGQGKKSIGIKRLPKFTFHDTGHRARTSECIYRVEKFREATPALGVHVDEMMGSASRFAMEGLVRYDAGHSKEGLDLIKKGMNQARECFYSWELVPGDAKRLEEELLDQGAMAVKLTGAGGGGMVVALWGEPT